MQNCPYFSMNLRCHIYWQIFAKKSEGGSQKYENQQYRLCRDKKFKTTFPLLLWEKPIVQCLRNQAFNHPDSNATIWILFIARPHSCHRYHRLYPLRKICHVEKFQISVKNLNNLWSFIKIYAVFVLNLCGEKSVWRKSLWRKNDKCEVCFLFATCQRQSRCMLFLDLFLVILFERYSGTSFLSENQFFASFIMQTFGISAIAEMLFSFRYSD